MPPRPPVWESQPASLTTSARSPSFLPGPTAPVDQTNQPQMTRPLRSTPITGASPLLRAGPPARHGEPAARLPMFHARAADQAHAASVPGTTWPVIGLPPGPAPAARSMATVSMPLVNVTTRQQRFGFTHLPGPHLTPHWCLFHIAHHDGLQPTQHVVVWSPPPKGDSEGPTVLHLSHRTDFRQSPLPAHQDLRSSFMAHAPAFSRYARLMRLYPPARPARRGAGGLRRRIPAMGVIDDYLEDLGDSQRAEL